MARCDLSILFRIGLLYLIYSNALAAAEATSDPQVRMGVSVHVIHDVSINDAEIGWKMLIDILAAETGETVDFKIYKSSEVVLRRFREGKLDFIFLDSLEYLDLVSSLRPSSSYVVQFGPQLKDRYLILVRKDLQAKELADLRGKKLAIPMGYTVARQFLKASLLEAGLPLAEHFFSKILNTEKVNDTIIDLYFGKVDVVLVPENDFNVASEMNPQIGTSITAIFSSQPMLMAAIAGRPGFPLWRKKLFEPYLLRETYPPKARYLMDTFHMTRFQHLDEDMLKEVKALRETLRALEQQPQ